MSIMDELKLISDSLEKIAVEEGSTALFKLHLSLKTVIDKLGDSCEENKPRTEPV